MSLSLASSSDVAGVLVMTKKYFLDLKVMTTASLNLMEYYRKHVKRQDQESAENVQNNDCKIQPSSDVQSKTKGKVSLGNQ